MPCNTLKATAVVTCVAVALLSAPDVRSREFTESDLIGSYGFMLRSAIADRFRATGVLDFDGEGGVTGYRLTVGQALEVGRALFEPALDP